MSYLRPTKSSTMRNDGLISLSSEKRVISRPSVGSVVSNKKTILRTKSEIIDKPEEIIVQKQNKKEEIIFQKQNKKEEIIFQKQNKKEEIIVQKQNKNKENKVQLKLQRQLAPLQVQQKTKTNIIKQQPQQPKTPVRDASSFGSVSLPKSLMDKGSGGSQNATSLKNSNLSFKSKNFERHSVPIEKMQELNEIAQNLVKAMRINTGSIGSAEKVRINEQDLSSQEIVKLRAKRKQLRIQAGARFSIGSEKVVLNDQGLVIQEIADSRAKRN